MNASRIILAAHRGDRKKHHENTMPAFEAALRFGADMIETDVHMTSDGHLVLIHEKPKAYLSLTSFRDEIHKKTATKNDSLKNLCQNGQ